MEMNIYCSTAISRRLAIDDGGNIIINIFSRDVPGRPEGLIYINISYEINEYKSYFFHYHLI